MAALVSDSNNSRHLETQVRVPLAVALAKVAAHLAPDHRLDPQTLAHLAKAVSARALVPARSTKRQLLVQVSVKANPPLALAQAPLLDLQDSANLVLDQEALLALDSNSNNRAPALANPRLATRAHPLASHLSALEARPCLAAPRVSVPVKARSDLRALALAKVNPHLALVNLRLAVARARSAPRALGPRALDRHRLDPRRLEAPRLARVEIAASVSEIAEGARLVQVPADLDREDPRLALDKAVVTALGVVPVVLDSKWEVRSVTNQAALALVTMVSSLNSKLPQRMIPTWSSICKYPPTAL